eukprot:2888199-Rhodomonas_salina.3
MECVHFAMLLSWIGSQRKLLTTDFKTVQEKHSVRLLSRTPRVPGYSLGPRSQDAPHIIVRPQQSLAIPDTEMLCGASAIR